MRSQEEIREKIYALAELNKQELLKQRGSTFPQMYRDDTSSRSGEIDGLCWTLGYKGLIDFIESEVRAGRASLGAEIDAKIKARTD